MNSFMNESKKLTVSPALMDTKSTIEALRTRCPLPVLMHRMGLGRYVRRSCCSPLRADHSASWGVYPRGDRWFWKDHGTGDGGDEIDFVASAKKVDVHKDFGRVLAYWEDLANTGPAASAPAELPEPEPRCKPDASGFGPGTDDQVQRLMKLRGFDRRGLLVAQERGMLVFGPFIGYEVYGVTDASGNVLEVRRLDGRQFPAHSGLAERKSHALKGSRKNWPVGIANAGDRPMILLVEGLPDFVAAFEVVVMENAADRVAPVAMLSAGSHLAADALPLFKGRSVRIIPHSDQAGRRGATVWKRELLEAGACKVDFFCLSDQGDSDDSVIKDLNDYLPLYRMEIAAGLAEGRIL